MKRVGVVVAVSLGLVGPAASQCALPGAHFYGQLCDQLQQGTDDLTNQGVSIDLGIKVAQQAPFGCEMFKLLTAKRIQLSRREVPWGLDVPTELGEAYKYYFSRRSNASLGYAILDVNPGSNCSSNGEVVYYAWSGDSMTALTASRCRPIKLILALREQSLCDGKLTLIRFPSAFDRNRRPEAAFLDIVKAVSDFLPPATEFRNRRLDLE